MWLNIAGIVLASFGFTLLTAVAFVVLIRANHAEKNQESLNAQS